MFVDSFPFKGKVGMGMVFGIALLLTPSPPQSSP